jgi:excisionase family DNA binding protein
MQPSRDGEPALLAIPGGLLTVKEAAKFLHVSAAVVYKLCENGDIQYVRISTHAIRIVRSGLADFIATRIAAR